jgi:xylulokinase
MLLMGIDVGTTGFKILLTRPNGEVVAKAYREYPVYRPKPTWVELDLDEVWRSIIVQTRRLVRSTCGERLVGLAVSSQGETVVPVNKAGECLGRAISWTDRRTEEQLEWWSKRYDAWEIYKITGQPLHPMFSVNKLMWIKKHRSELYRKAYKFLCVEDFFNFKLTSNPITDYSIAARTMMLDIRKKEWSSEIIEATGIDRTKLPDLAPSGKLIGEIGEDVAKKIGLSGRTYVTTGGHDHSVAAFGVGITRDGPALNDLGTSESILAVTKKPMLRRHLFEGGYACCPHVKEDMFVVLSGIATAGAVLRWFRDQFGERERAVAKRRKMSVYDVMMDEASSSQPGALGLLFLPHFAGTMTPYLDPKSKGALLGLRLFHTRSDLLRSIAEGIIFEQRNNIEYQESEGIRISDLRVTGGGAGNEFWLQLRADILGKNIVVPQITEATVFGTALLAGIGTKIYGSFEEAQRKTYHVRKIFSPNRDVQRKYDAFYELHRKTYPSLRRIFQEMQ